MHVHVLGNGKSGSGCRIALRWWQRPFIDWMAANVGLQISPSDPALDQRYIERLLDWVKESTLERAVILACDDLYDETGHRFPGLSGLFVPNNYVFELSKRHPEFLPAASIHPARPDAIAEFQAIQFQLARLATDVEAARLEIVQQSTSAQDAKAGD